MNLEHLSFVPHVRDGHPLADSTRVCIGSQSSRAPADALLLNLAAHVPDGFEQRHHIVEIVGQDEADREAARARFVRYRQGGFEMHTRHATAADA